MNKILPLLLLLLPALGFAQAVNAPLNRDYYHLVERYEIRQGHFSPQLFTAMRPYSRKGIALWADTLAQQEGWSKADRFNLEYLRNDNWEWIPESTEESKKPILKHFYRRPSDLYHVQEKNFNLHVNPVASFGMGITNDRDETLFASGRGVEIRGTIADAVGFYTFITDNQVMLPQYVVGKPGAPKGNVPTIAKEGGLPGAGFWKNINDIEPGYEFFRARGHISINPIDEISIQVGHDRQFIGHGYRSMALSDFAPNYFFIRLNTQVWKFNYTNLFASVAPRALTDGEVFTDKYLAMHHLSLNITDNLNIGVFENITFSRGDSLQSQTFDPNYVNPIIFLRAAEHNRASLDNVILGADAKWIPFKGMQVYGQITFDDFKMKEFLGITSEGSYLNKYGIQAGFKYIDAFGVSNFDIQGEWNKVRPFTYSHNQSNRRLSVNDANYQHFGQPLAHPLGANFWEALCSIRYQPFPRLQLHAMGVFAKMGEDPAGDENWGGDIFKDYNDPIQQTGNDLLQGVEATLQYVDLTASYQVKHNLFIDLKQVVRRLDSEDDQRDIDTSYTTVTVRWNIPQWRYEF